MVADPTPAPADAGREAGWLTIPEQHGSMVREKLSSACFRSDPDGLAIALLGDEADAQRTAKETAERERDEARRDADRFDIRAAEEQVKGIRLARRLTEALALAEEAISNMPGARVPECHVGHQREAHKARLRARLAHLRGEGA